MFEQPDSCAYHYLTCYFDKWRITTSGWVRLLRLSCDCCSRVYEIESVVERKHGDMRSIREIMNGGGID